MGDSDNEDDTYVTIGTAFDVPEDDEPLKKPSKIEDQIAVDKQGRRRFHGAFTGGFSAGYFNSVGSKEGWTPSTFVSSRSKRIEQSNEVSKPEDFMDEEDFAEHGIAPRQLKTTTHFKSTEDEILERKRHLQKQIDDGDLQSAIPGGLIIDDLILPSNLSIGIKLLNKMGWKQGQGVGEKMEISKPNKDNGSAKKVYGCMRPEGNEALDMSSLRTMLAPKDVVAISFERKDNLHGIGYSGIDPYTAMHGNIDKSNTQKAFRPTGNEKRGIRGQAFGVGVFEDEDDDIYNHDNLSNYDISMSREDENDTHGWSGAPKYEKNKGCLNGFVKSKKTMKPPSVPKMITIPSNYIPKHTFEEPKQASTVEDIDKARHQMDSKERSLLLGESSKTLDDVNQWALRWDKKPDLSAENDTVDNKDNDKEKRNRFSSRWDKEIHQERPKQQPVAEPHDPSASVYDPDTKTFRPFAKYPLKQARYEEFLKAKKSGKKPELKYDRLVTEWERERELDEFSRASILYRPLNNTFSSRFTPATSVSDDSAKASASTGDNKDDNIPSDKKAAKMGMFGKLTRTTLEWHPESLLCKRFNIPDPYPHSKVRGVPSRGRKTKTSFFETDIKMLEETNNTGEEETEKENDFTEKLTKTDSVTQQKKAIKFGPLSHLNRQVEKYDQDSIAPTLTQTLETNSQNEKENAKPSIDIFKAIFDNSDSSNSESSASDEDPEDESSKTAGQKNDDTLLQSSDNSINLPRSDFAQAPPKSLNKESGKDDNQSVERSLNDSQTSKPVLPLLFLNKDQRKTSETASKRFSSPHRKNSHTSEMSDNKNSAKTLSNHGLANKFDRDKPKSKNDYVECYSSSKDSESDEWEETSSSKKRSKKKKKEKKHKKEKRNSKSRREDEKDKKEKKHKSKHSKRDKSSKRSKRDQQRSSESDSSDDEESLIPSNALLLQKLKQVQSGMKKRPSAADFM